MLQQLKQCDKWNYFPMSVMILQHSSFFFNDLFDNLNKRNYVPTDPQSDYAFLLNSVRCLETMEFVKQTYFGGPILPDTDSDENEQIH